MANLLRRISYIPSAIPDSRYTLDRRRTPRSLSRAGWYLEGVMGRVRTPGPFISANRPHPTSYMLEQALGVESSSRFPYSTAAGLLGREPTSHLQEIITMISSSRGSEYHLSARSQGREGQGPRKDGSDENNGCRDCSDQKTASRELHIDRAEQGRRDHQEPESPVGSGGNRALEPGARAWGNTPF